jgi:hypothetical protein
MIIYSFHQIENARTTARLGLIDSIIIIISFVAMISLLYFHII